MTKLLVLLLTNIYHHESNPSPLQAYIWYVFKKPACLVMANLSYSVFPPRASRVLTPTHAVHEHISMPFLVKEKFQDFDLICRQQVHKEFQVIIFLMSEYVLSISFSEILQLVQIDLIRFVARKFTASSGVIGQSDTVILRPVSFANKPWQDINFIV